MKLVPFLIDSLGEALSSGVQFSAMKNLVRDMQDSHLSGEEKAEKVKNMFVAIGYGLAGWLVNLLLELAVAYIKQEAAKR